MTDHKALSCPVWLQPIIIAMQFMTRIPMPNIGVVDNSIVGKSILYYPLVGVVMGGLIWMMQVVFNWLWPDQWGIQAALLLAVWCLLTGGLHLDGLADSADAWVGGLGSKERTLALMKDPTCGPAAVTLLVLLLLIKYAAIENLIKSYPIGLVLAPVVARGTLLLLFLTTRYVREGGLGEILTQHLSVGACTCLLVILSVSLMLLGEIGFQVLLLTLLFFIALRHLMIRRIGGTTGDTAGALVEVIEMAVLMAVII
ncbi:adenosylcobinamide-GDP ribazoletransferase [Motiliproteus sp. MSK22-1]|uniref:adenosylcobinamide-GDP ribazoletransferase n=1 Tax=Motiliproteus sp. MSK22-1 TaxID=1897630 RepID=UPI0009F92FAC|nr:adenosylcobinamide-GDP ribazoletransferase [Motiliproteus sp. MSK22-1]